MDKIWKEIKFNKDGLVPTIIQDIYSKDVLMLAYMNRESLEKTIETKTTWFYSRSRKRLWNKGETSGHYQKVLELFYDCDGDTLLIKVIQEGNACHTGERSCFFNKIYKEEHQEDKDVLELLYQRIQNRKLNPQEGSYTNYLFDKGKDKILKKVGEETSEVIIGAKNNSQDEVIYETADLTYHILVLLNEMGISIESIKNELYKRYK
jgi:phosphoribosyl-ATP pyrophosphohydrolase/phosphoribosyl-AMP cyclohydrolase